MRCLAFCGLLLALAAAAGAQPSPPGSPPGEPARVAAVDLTGDLGPFDAAALRELLRTRPNRRFLGIPGVTPGLWTYRLGESGILPAPVAEAAPATLLDPGESVLQLSAWDGADAPHTLPRDTAFSARLGTMDRAEAANAGVDDILSAL